MSNLTEPQSLLREIANRTSGELTSVEVIAYVEALSRSASTLAAVEKDYTVKPSAINSTLSVGSVYHCCFSVNTWSYAETAAMFWTGLKEHLLLHVPSIKTCSLKSLNAIMRYLWGIAKVFITLCTFSFCCVTATNVSIFNFFVVVIFTDNNHEGNKHLYVKNQQNVVPNFGVESKCFILFSISVFGKKILIVKYAFAFSPLCSHPVKPIAFRSHIFSKWAVSRMCCLPEVRDTANVEEGSLLKWDQDSTFWFI